MRQSTITNVLLLCTFIFGFLKVWFPFIGLSVICTAISLLQVYCIVRLIITNLGSRDVWSYNKYQKTFLLILTLVKQTLANIAQSSL